MSKAEKMRDRLANMQKERSEFEKQKRELEAQMNIGRQNMGKIQKGLKNNDLNLQDQIQIEAPISQLTENVNSSIAQSQNAGVAAKRLSKSNPRPNVSQISSQPAQSGHPHPPVESSPSAHPSNVIIPTGARISDWCYVGALDSQPPVVKSRDLYETVRLLGRGSFGEVNLVKNTDDNKLFAIKTIFCSRDSDMDVVLREIKFLRINRHPYVIDVHDAFVTSNPRVVHIVMHYCESGTVASVIQSAKKNKSSISETQIIKWTIQLALAMQFLHSNNILHRDLKPMNVMITEGGDLLKLADFGLALDMGEASDKENFDEAGTPYYTAPEMIQRESYSFPADCWSFGIIIFQLMALERPFEGSSTADLVRAILSAEPPPLPPHYSEEMKSIAKDLLRKNQHERMTMVGLLSEPIIVAKLNNFAQSYRPRHLEERIRRSHTKQLEQQLETVGRSRRSTLARGKAESANNSTTNSPRIDDVTAVALLQEIPEHSIGHHKSELNVSSPNKDLDSHKQITKSSSNSQITPSAVPATGGLEVTAHHIVPEPHSISSAEVKKETGSTHSLHHSPSGHHNLGDHLGHNLEHHHHHDTKQEPMSLLQKSLSNIILDVNAETDHGTTDNKTRVDESSLEDILVLGHQLTSGHAGTNGDDSLNIAGGRKGAEIQKAIQQDQEVEKGLNLPS